MQGWLNLLKLSEEDFKKIVEEEANKLWAAVANDTPIDTGLARASWKLSNTSVPGRVEFVLSNDVPYIVYLEYGWSKQAPKGMLRINLRRYRKNLQDRIRRRLAKLASE